MRMTGMLSFFLFFSAAQAEPIYRCTGTSGELRFSDRACRGGEAFEPPIPNVVSAEDSAYRYERTPEPAGSSRKRGTSTRPARDCDNAAELRHIDLMLKSLRADKRQQQFLKAERRRVANCEHEALSGEERQQRDAALRRTGSLRGSQRTEAETEIEDLYGARRSSGRSKKR